MTEFTLAGASVAFTSFVRRQTEKSHFSHWTISDDEMLNRIQDAVFRPGGVSEGYRDGVVLAHIKVEPGEFYTGVVELSPGDKLVGEYKARRPGEEPRKEIYANHVPASLLTGELHTDETSVYLPPTKTEAVAVDVVLYSHEVLLEGNENETDSDWEIVSVNARPTHGPQPIHPITLMHNHFGSDGGTNTKMSPGEFESSLREGFEYWKNRAMLAPKE